MSVEGPVRGVGLDAESRCTHYHSANDIIAIRMRCCGVYYACAACHEALAGHPSERWEPAEQDVGAVRCGACGAVLSIRQYLSCGDRCPGCGAPFNPGCRNHYHLYFVLTKDATLAIPEAL